jgi:hypothetical protein
MVRRMGGWPIAGQAAPSSDPGEGDGGELIAQCEPELSDNWGDPDPDHHRPRLGSPAPGVPLSASMRRHRRHLRVAWRDRRFLANDGEDRLSHATDRNTARSARRRVVGPAIENVGFPQNRLT